MNTLLISKGKLMSRFIILVCCLLLTWCNQSKKLDNVTNFSSRGSGDYLLFQLIDNKSIITVRDINTLKVKNKLKLKNNDPIYFVDNIKK